MQYSVFRQIRVNAMSFLTAAACLTAAASSTAGVVFAAEAADGTKAAPNAAHPTPAGIEFFEKKIRPVLVQKCYQCHSSNAESVKGELRLDTRDALLKGGESGAAIVPGDSESSLLMEALRFEGLEMPPTGKLSDDQIADFAKWIDMGAPDPRTSAAPKKGLNLAEARQFWAFKQPIKRPPPTVADTSWPAGDVDRFVLAALEQQGLTPAAEADPATLCRRLYFDLIGLPPSPAELDEFVRAYSTSNDRAKVYAALVDKLLASPQFGERWGRHWLDIARYGESTGKERNIPYTHAWKYRDWVIDAFNSDKPYTKFITEQIAGDLLPADTAEQKNDQAVGTGFLALGPKSINERNLEQYVMDIVDEQIDVTTRAFLATTVGCARCHDHKFDPIPQTDYYALAGIFRSTETLSGVSGRGKNAANRDYSGALMPLADAGTTPAKPAASDPLAGLSKSDREEYDKLAKRVAARIEERDRVLQMGKQGNEKSKKEAKKQYQSLTQQIAKDEKKLEQLRSGISSTAVAASDFAMGVCDAAKPADTEVRVRGEPDERGAVVARGFVSVLKSSQSPKVNTAQSGRLELAQWIAGRDNPLTARVAVNRIWYHLFGRGLVETVDNFGALGEEPTHPELLDYLAVQFMDQGWSTKTAIRNIVLSRAYRMSSDHDAADFAKDPANIYLWRMNRRRLEAEAIRDAMLAASGTLDLTRPEASPVAKLSASNEVGRRGPLELDDASVARHRSVYLPLLRNGVPEVLTVFDVADPSLVVGQRESTTVATQALFLMNSPFAAEHARAAAERLIVQVPSDETLRVEAAYRTILSRPATAAERQLGAKFVNDYVTAATEEGVAEKNRELDAWTALCQSLFASAEFRYVY